MVVFFFFLVICEVTLTAVIWLKKTQESSLHGSGLTILSFKMQPRHKSRPGVRGNFSDEGHMLNTAVRSSTTYHH